jgi:hypothetical protein
MDIVPDNRSIHLITSKVEDVNDNYLININETNNTNTNQISQLDAVSLATSMRSTLATTDRTLSDTASNSFGQSSNNSACYGVCFIYFMFQLSDVWQFLKK